MMKFALILSIFCFLLLSAEAKPHPNALAVGQGISSPTLTSTINFSEGFMRENPVGVAYLNGLRLAGEYVSDTNNATGAELGLGNSRYGLAVGTIKSDCDGCSSSSRGALGAIFTGIGIGVGASENRAALGLIFNPNGTHRIGLLGEQHTPSGANDDFTQAGIGYSYVAEGWTFTVDASKTQYENSAVTIGDVIAVTPGLAFRFDLFALSFSYNNFLNDDGDVFSDKLWGGLGIGDAEDWHIALYGSYVGDASLALNLMF